MRVSGNSTTKLNRIIGTIGFDRIVLSNLNGTSLPYKTPVQQYLPDQSLIDTPIHDHTIQASPNKIRIYGKNYVYSFGNQGGRAFEKIELRASNEKEENLQNLSVYDVKNAFQEAATDILNIYKIDIKKSVDSIRVYAAEINVTVPITHPMHEYTRILHLLGHARQTGEVVSEKKELETYHINSGKTKELKIYSKSEQLTQIHHIDCDTSLLRFETYETEQILSQMATTEESKSNKRLPLSELTQENLEKHFITFIKKEFKKNDQMLASNLNFKSKPEINKHLTAIFSLAMQKVLHMDASSFAESILLYFHSEERKIGTPILLDIRNLLDAMNSTTLPPHIKKSMEKAFNNIIENRNEFNEIINSFIGQKELYEELKEKLCNKETYQLTLYQEEGRNALIWWDNPNHTSCQYASDLSLDHKVDHDLREMIENKYPENKFEQNFMLLRTTNIPPIYYTIRKGFEYDEETDSLSVSEDNDIRIISDRFVEQKNKELKETLKNYELEETLKKQGLYPDQTDYNEEV